MAGAVGPHPEPLLPAGLRRRGLVRRDANPAGADRHQRAGIAGRARTVVDLAGLHLGAAGHERDGLGAVEQDSSGGQLVAEAGGAGLEFAGGAAHDHRRALRLDLLRLEPALCGAALPARLAAEEDRKQVARELVGAAFGHGPEHVDVILERDHVGRDVEAEAAPAADEHRWRSRRGRSGFRGGRGLLAGRRGRRRRCGGGLVSRQQPALQALEPHAHVAIETDRVDTTDVRPLPERITAAAPLTGPRLEGGHEPAAAAARAAVAKLHHLTGPDLELVELDVAGHDLDVVLAAGSRRRAADRDLPAEAAADEPGQPALPEIERLVELEHGPLRRPHHDRAAGGTVGHAVAVGEHDQRAGHEVDAAVGQ